MSACYENVVPLRIPVPVALTQGTLALDLEPRREAPLAPALARVPDLGAEALSASEEGRLQRQVDAWALRFAQAVVEIVGGDRPVSQLARWVTREVYVDLERRAVLVGRAGGHQPGAGRVQPVRARVRSVRSSVVGPHAVEAGVHVQYGPRSRALAARFERRGAGWVCQALEFA